MKPNRNRPVPASELGRVFLEGRSEKACGPKEISWLIPQSILGVDITDACEQHDVHYVGRNIDRKEADKVFLTNMVGEIDRAKGWRFLYIFRRIGALAYYAAVRVFGGFFVK